MTKLKKEKYSSDSDDDNEHDIINSEDENDDNDDNDIINSEDDDDDEEENEIIDEDEEDVIDEEYQDIDKSTDDEDEDDDEENEEEIDLENIIEEEGDDVDLENMIDQDEEEINNDEDMFDDDKDEQTFEGTKRKKISSRKKISRKIFPFIQKKRKKCVQIQRKKLEFVDLDVRQTNKSFLTNIITNYTSKNIIQLERNIFNATVRKCKNLKLEEISEDEIEFKKIYLEITKYVISAIKQINIEEIIQELKLDTYGWKSRIFQKAMIEEEKEINKIKNPIQSSENPDNPCPKCKGIMSFKVLRQLRGGDEGQSALFWCSSKQCGHHWRVNG